jgi:hypothetical protein
MSLRMSLINGPYGAAPDPSKWTYDLGRWTDNNELETWPRSVRTPRVSFMTYKGTTAERSAGGARAAAARPGSRERTAAARETGLGTTILRRH